MNPIYEPLRAYQSKYVLSVLLICILWSVTATQFVSAQVISNEQRSTAQIRQSREAHRLIQDGISKRQNGNLSTFIENLQKARDNYKNWLVPVQSENGLFVSVYHRTNTLLMTLNEEGRKIYRNKYEQKARALLKKARRRNSTSDMYTVADRYPLTKSALEALDHLGTRRFKEGKINRALKIYKQKYQLLTTQEKKISSARRIAYCMSVLGQMESLKQFKEEVIDQLRSEFGMNTQNAKTLASFFDGQIEQARNNKYNEKQNVSTGNNWSPNQRNQAPAVQLQNLDTDQLKPKIIFPVPEGAAKRFRYNRIRRSSTERGIEKIQGVYPLVADGHLLLNNGVSCWGWSLPNNDQSLVKEPTWTFSVDDVSGSDVMKDERLIFRGSASDDGNYFCSLVTDLGKSEKQMIKLQVRFPIPWRALFSINASSGEVNWKRGGPSDEGFAKNASFPSGATHRDGTLFATAVKFQTSKDTPDLFGTAIDASSGNIRWSTFLTKNMLGTNLFENPIREVIPDVPLVDEEHVYLNTNTGIIAALDRETGNLNWLYRYMQWPFPDTQSIYPQRQRTYWSNNLPLQMGNTLLFTPTDSIRLIAIDRETGRVKWVQKQSKIHEKLNGFARWLIPLTDERYLLASEERIVIHSASSGKPVSKALDTPLSIMGRPAILQNYIALPTKKGIKLVRYQQKGNGQIQLSMGVTLSPQKYYEPGNVFFHETHMMITGPKQFSYFQLFSN